MAANIIESFFVSLGFEIDTERLNDFEQALQGARDTVLAVGTVAAAAAGAIGLFVTQVAQGIDELGDFAEMENVSIEALQEIGHAAQISGSSLEAVKASVSGVNKVVGEAALGIGRGAKTFQQLGMSAKNADGSVKTFDQVLEGVIDRMEGLSRQEQIALAEKLGIDRSLIPLLAKGRDELEALRAEARAFGIASEEDAEKAGLLTDALDRTRFMLGALGKYIAVSFMPQVTAVLDGFRAWLLAHEKIIKSGIGSALKVVTAIVGTMWDWVVRLANGLVGLVSWLDSFSTATKIAAAVGLMLGAALAIPGAMIGLLVAALVLVVDELVNFYEGNDTVIGQLLTQFPNAGKALVTALGGITAAFIALKWQAVSAWLATIGGAIRSAVVTVAAAASISGGLLSLIGMYVMVAAKAIAAGIASAAAWLVAIAPIVLVIAAIAAVSFAIYQLWANWEKVTGWIGEAWDAVTAKISGFVDGVMGAIGKVGQLLGLTNDASRVNLAMGAGAGHPTASATAGNSLNAAGGVIGRAGSSVSNSSSVTQTTTITAPITITSPDPAKAGESVRQELGRLNKQAVRNGQSAVAL